MCADQGLFILLLCQPLPPWGLLVWILRTGLRPGRLCWQGLPSSGYPRGGQGSDGPGGPVGPWSRAKVTLFCGLQPQIAPGTVAIVSEHLRLLRETDLGRWPESPFQVGLGPKAAVSTYHTWAHVRPAGISEPSLSQEMSQEGVWCQRLSICWNLLWVGSDHTV